MSQFTLTVLGGFEVRDDLGHPVAVPTRKAQALLAYLAVTPGQPHPRDKLAAFLWGDTAPAAARTALRQTLIILRKVIGEHLLTGPGNAVSLSPNVVTDRADFERAVAEGNPASLERALDVYGGDFLAGLTVDASAFEDWLMSERERLSELATEAFARLLRHQRSSGANEAAVHTALRLLAIVPLDESVHRALMALYSELGRRDAALRQYQTCVAVLAREL